MSENRLLNPMDAVFAARIRNSKSGKMSAKRSWQILQQQQVQELKDVITEDLKNVTPTKFNGCVDIEKVGHGK
jgi:hypothetical protein